MKQITLSGSRALFTQLVRGEGRARGLGLCGLLLVLSCSAPTPETQGDEGELQVQTSALNLLGVTDTRPSVYWGGRIQSVDVDPNNPAIAIAASDNGGLFRTTNSGTNWTHLDSFLPAQAVDVAFIDSNRVVVTAHQDQRLRNTRTTAVATSPANGGGIWFSSNGGTTWTRPTGHAPTPVAGGVPQLFYSAYGIGVLRGTQTVFIGTDLGLAVSNDGGATIASHIRVTAPAAPADVRVTAVAAQPGTGGNTIIDILTDGGHRRSTNTGVAWSAASFPAGATQVLGPEAFAPHALAVSPLNRTVVFIAVAVSLPIDIDGNGTINDSSYQVFESFNSGTTWTSLNVPPRGRNRLPFVVASPAYSANTKFDLWVGDGADMHNTSCGIAPDPDGDTIPNSPACTPGCLDGAPFNGVCDTCVDLVNNGTRKPPVDGLCDSGCANTNGDTLCDGTARWTFVNLRPGCGGGIACATDTTNTCPETGGPCSHNDPSDLVFHPTNAFNCTTTGRPLPWMIAADGGIERTTVADCGVNFSVVGGGAGGLNALELYQVTGQVHAVGLPTYLYFGTQDNDLWASTTGGTTWAKQIPFEGFGIEVAHFSAALPSTTAGSLVLTGAACGACNNFYADAAFNSSTAWVNPPVLPGPCTDGNVDGACDAAVAPCTVIFGLNICSNCADIDLNGVCDGTACLNTNRDAVCDDALIACRDANADAICDAAVAPCANNANGLRVCQTGGGFAACVDANSNNVCDGVVCPDADGDFLCDGQQPFIASEMLAPKLVSPGVYVQFASKSSLNVAGQRQWHLWRTQAGTPPGTVWQIVPGGTVIAPGLRGKNVVVGPAATPTLYTGLDLGVGASTDVDQLQRINNILGNATQNRSTLPSSIVTRFMLAPAWAVDPKTPLFLIAGLADNTIRRSTDGGLTWSAPMTQSDQDLLRLSTANGTYAFNSPMLFLFGDVASQVSAMEFDANSQTVLVGTENAGVISSLDNGQTWARVCRSDQIPRVTSFFFDEGTGTTYASSYGRGLWTVKPNEQQVPTFGATIPGPLTVHDCGSANIGTPTATDPCEGLNVEVTNDIAGCNTAVRPCGTFTRGPGEVSKTTTVNWLATDDKGGQKKATSSVIVQDTTGPIGTTAPPPIVLSRNTSLTFTDLDPGNVRFASDGCQGSIPATQWTTNPPLPGDLPFGVTDVSWIPRDDLGNVGTPATQRVLVVGGEGDIAGDGFTCELSPLGEVTCFGAGISGRLGDGTYTTRWAPGPVTLTNVRQLSVGSSHACAVRGDGTVWCWGENADGRLGTGLTFVDSTVPMQVPGLTNVKQVSAGPLHTCAVTTGGALYCWGENNDGRLGVFGLFLDQLTPIQVTSLSNVKQVSAGTAHTCAVLNNGDLYCWGENADGRLGNLAPFDQQVPMKVPSLTNVKQVSAGFAHTCAVLQDGRLYCWGEDADGRLGIGLTIFDQQTPAQVTTLTGVVEVSAGTAHTCAVLSTGQVACWGENSEGRLGIGPTTQDATTPVFIPGLVDAVQVSSGNTHTCAIRSHAERVCWGDNLFGELGDGTGVDRSSTQVSAGLCNAQSIEVGKDFSCAIGRSNFATYPYCWGTNLFGQLGVGEIGDRLAPWQLKDQGFATKVSAGDEHGCTISGFAQLSCWGRNLDGRVGDGTLIDRNKPTPVFTTPPPSPNAANCFYREASGKAYYFCTNDLSWSLARDACRTVGMQPVRIDDQVEDDFVESYVVGSTWIGANDRSVEATWRWAEGVTDNGPQLWSGGAPFLGGTALLYTNWFGPFEPGIPNCARIDTTGAWVATDCNAAADYVCEGTAVPAPNAIDVSAGATHTCAITATNQVRCWGANTDGMLGDGTIIARKVPTPVSGLTGTPLQVGSGDRHSCALMLAAGGAREVWCWGDGANGRLGRNSTTDSSVPVKVQGLTTDVAELSVGAEHSCARTTPGTVFCWGRGTFGRVGLGNQTDRLTAGQVLVSGASLNAISISAGREHSCAVRATGAALCWGRNLGAQLGDGTLVDRLSPVSVVGLTSATAISAGLDHSCAVRNDGTTEQEVVCWGNNAQGELGTGTFVSSFSPVAAGGSACEVF